MIDVGAFRSHGYQVVRGALDAAVLAEVREFLAEEVARATKTMSAALGASDTASLVRKIDEASSRVEGFDEPLRKLMSGHFPLETRLSPRLWRSLDAGLANVARELFPGEALRMHMPPAARFVLPGNKHAGVPNHRDRSYNAHMSEFVTTWVPLVEIDEVCGGVRVFEGTHGQMEDEEPGADGFWLRGVDAKDSRGVAPRMSPGDVLVLSSTILHESVENRSDRVRLSIDYRFFGDRNTSSKHYLDVSSRRVVAPEAK